MTHRIFVAALLLTAAPCLVAPAAAAPAADPAPPVRPALLVKAPVLDLGTVQEGQDAVAVFQLQNTGGADLRVLSARPG